MHVLRVIYVQITHSVCCKWRKRSLYVTPGGAWQEDEENHTRRKNNCVRRKWESHSTKEVFLRCLPARSQIKAAVNWSNICISLPFFFFFYCAHLQCSVFMQTHRKPIFTHTHTHTHSQLHPFSSGDLSWRQEWGGGGLFLPHWQHMPPQGWQRAGATVQRACPCHRGNNILQGNIPTSVRLLHPTSDALSLVKVQVTSAECS